MNNIKMTIVEVMIVAGIFLGMLGMLMVPAVKAVQTITQVESGYINDIDFTDGDGESNK